MPRARIRVQCRSENAQAHKRRAEYCELLFNKTGLWVSQSTMCRTFQRLKLPLKKKRSALAKQKAKEAMLSASDRPRRHWTRTRPHSSEPSIGNK